MDEFHLLLDVEVHSPLDVFWKHCGGISRPPIGSQVFSRCNCRLGPERERGKSIGTTLGSIKGIIVYERTYLSFIQDKSSKLVCIICSVLIIFKLI